MCALMSAVLCGCQLTVAVMQAPELCLAPPNRDARHRVRARHFPHVHLLVGSLYCRTPFSFTILCRRCSLQQLDQARPVAAPWLSCVPSFFTTRIALHLHLPIAQVVCKTGPALPAALSHTPCPDCCLEVHVGSWNVGPKRCHAELNGGAE